MTLAHFFPGNWLLHCSKLCPKPSMPYYAHEKGPSTMAGPQRYEISLVSSTKGCSKQIHDLLTGGAGLFLRWVRLNSVSLLILSGLHGYFGTFPRGIGYFHCFLALCSSACKKYVNLARGLCLLNVPVLINFPCGKR